MKETILLCEFNSLIDAMEYMNNTNDKFIFLVNDKIYSIDGIELTSEESLIFTEDLDLKIVNISTIIGEIYVNPTEGQLYIKNNILTFFSN